MPSDKPTLFSVKAAMRLVSLLPALIIGVFLSRGIEVFSYEPFETFKFILSLFLTFLPFCLIAEWSISRRASSFLQAVAIYVQCTFAALVFYKYLVAPSLIATFRYQAFQLYASVEVCLLLFLSVQLFFQTRGVKTKPGLFSLVFGAIGLGTLVMFFSMATVVIQKKWEIIPRFSIPFLVDSKWFEDRSVEYGVEVFSPDLNIDNAIQILESPSDSAAFLVLARDGRLFAIEDQVSGYVSRKLLDLSEQIYGFEIELGAAGAIFGPKVVDRAGRPSRDLFLYYAYKNNQGVWSQLVSYSVSIPDLKIDKDSEKILIRQEQPSEMHNGGGLEFGPDGYLYIGVGDGGPENDESGNAQLADNGFFSGILRIDVYGENRDRVKSIDRQPVNGQTQGYWIPQDNPFVGQEEVLEEFWALGLRNPFRIMFPQDSDKLLIGDVGQGYYEELNWISAGANCQWSFREGPLPYTISRHKGKKPSQFFGEEVAPFFYYKNSLIRGCIIGGIVYEGNKFSELSGKYIFGDWRSGEVFAIDLNDDGNVNPVRLISSESNVDATPSLITSFFEYDGEILMTRLGPGAGGNSILRISRADEVEVPLATGFETLTANQKYLTLCSRCHGANGEPTLLGQHSGVIKPRNFTDVVWQKETSDEKIIKSISEGIVGEDGATLMPAWKSILSEEDIQELAILIRGFVKENSR